MWMPNPTKRSSKSFSVSNFSASMFLPRISLYTYSIISFFLSYLFYLLIYFTCFLVCPFITTATVVEMRGRWGGRFGFKHMQTQSCLFISFLQIDFDDQPSFFLSSILLSFISNQNTIEDSP